MRMIRTLALALMPILAAPSGLLAAVCMQDKAIYVDTLGAHRLGFSRIESEAAAISHQFKFDLGDGLVMDGFVIIQSCDVDLPELVEVRDSPSVNLFSKSSHSFLRYFAPVNVYFDNKNKYFSV